MTKTSKTLAAFTMAALVTGGTVLAQSTPAKHNGSKRGSLVRCENQTVILGQVRTVNTKENTIKIANTDGKEIELKVVPFTKIKISPMTGNSEVQIGKIEEIRRNSWVAITTFKTDTKTVVAADIFVKQDKVEANSTIDAK